MKRIGSARSRIGLGIFLAALTSFGETAPIARVPPVGEIIPRAQFSQLMKLRGFVNPSKFGWRGPNFSTRSFLRQKGEAVDFQLMSYERANGIGTFSFSSRGHWRPGGNPVPYGQVLANHGKDSEWNVVHGGTELFIDPAMPPRNLSGAEAQALFAQNLDEWVSFFEMRAKSLYSRSVAPYELIDDNWVSMR